MSDIFPKARERKMTKRHIGIRELRNNLSATLARVRRGESITVTDRNRAVAVIVPAEDLVEVVHALAKSGRLTWSSGKPAGLKNAGRVRGRSVAEAAVEDRR